MSEKTTTGAAGRLVGRIKEMVGETTNRDDLAREGRLQRAQGQAETEARRLAETADRAEASGDLERERAETDARRAELRTEIAGSERDEAIEQQRREEEHDAASDATRERDKARNEREAAEAAQHRADALDPDIDPKG